MASFREGFFWKSSLEMALSLLWYGLIYVPIMEWMGVYPWGPVALGALLFCIAIALWFCAFCVDAWRIFREKGPTSKSR